MYKSVSAFGAFNNQTGYGIHATSFFEELNKIIPVKRSEPGGNATISLLDSVSAQHITTRHHLAPSILYNVWESTQQPARFIENLKYYDQLWVPSEWQRQCTIAQGVDPNFVKVVPEGIDPHLCKPIDPAEYNPTDTFNFLIVGKWESRKYTKEMIQAWLEVFEGNDNVRLYVMADNPFHHFSTEDKLKVCGFDDPRIIPLPNEPHEDCIRRMQSTDVYLSCSRAEGWNLPLIEAMACGIPSIALDYSGSTEYAKDAMLVIVKKMIKPFGLIGMKDEDCPGQWAEPDYEDLKRVIEDAYDDYESHKIKALETSAYIRKNFTWKKAAQKAYDLLCALEIPKLEAKQENSIEELRAKFTVEASKLGYEIGSFELKKRNDIFVVGCWPNSQERMDTLVETIQQIKSLGYPVLISSHYPLPAPVIELADFYLYDKENILSDDTFKPIYSRINQQGQREEAYSKARRHDVACLTAIRNAIDFCRGKYARMYFMEFDVEVDLEEWISKVRVSKAPFAFIDYEKIGLRTDIFAGEVSYLDSAILRIGSWQQYAQGGVLILEQWMKRALQEYDVDVIDCEVNNRFDQVDREIWPDDVFQAHFVDGPFLQISGISNRVYDVTFFNPQDGDSCRLQQKCGTWSRPGKKYYRDWEIIAKLDGEEKFRAKMDSAGKRVLISMGSKALGDTLAWMPFIEEFRKKHQCHVVASSWWNKIFDYPEIEFVEPGSKVENIYASYEIGCYDGDSNRNPADWRTVTLQKIAVDILGLEYQETRPKLKVPPIGFSKTTPYVCISEFSTMQAKLWNNPGAWQMIVDYLVHKQNISVVSISREETTLRDVAKINSRPIEETIAALAGAKFYIGLGHGPSWLAWALNIPVILISGFSEPWAEFPTPYRVINNGVCHGCFNDPTAKFDRSWEWCPRKKNYECTREITPAMVIKQIDRLLAE